MASPLPSGASIAPVCTRPSFRGAVSCELHVTPHPRPDERLPMLLGRLDALLRHHHAAVVRHETFGSLAAYGDCLVSMKRVFGDVNWPVT